MTFAERYRKNKPIDFTDFFEWANFIDQIDRQASLQRTDLGTVIQFSDGSMHRMGASHSKEQIVECLKQGV